MILSCMNRHLAQAIVCAGLIALASPAVGALSYTYSGPAVTIPDNDASGRAFAFSLTDAATTIASLTVTVNISGGRNGDLYAFLSHNSGYTVLLNRTGRGVTTSGSSTDGYANSGFAMTFSSSGAANVHFYQNSSPSFNGSGQLTGTWQPDGRTIDPESSAASFDAGGSASFSSFVGQNPNGAWTLFFADVSALSESTLNGFSVDVVAAVPEPVNAALAVSACLVLMSGIWRWARRRS
jgi:subtilisin-like proprotein convertase family protein